MYTDTGVPIMTTQMLTGHIGDVLSSQSRLITREKWRCIHTFT